jgi:hypothetical protein
MKKTSLLVILFITLITSLTSCGIYKKTDAREVPVNALERARKNVEEGRGAGLGNLLNRGKNGFEFSSSNPMWRASLEIIEFMPLANVDYSGGLISTDWYNDATNKDTSVKITIRFLSNEISSDSLKITVHQKKCDKNFNCSITLLDSKIKTELQRSILTKATQISKNSK